MPVHFVLCLHNHQPVGNFGFVLEKACADAYEPFLDVMERHPAMKAVVHYSGVLLRWFEERRPGFLERWARLAADGRAEFLGGGFYEPILAVIPPEDRAGQLERMNAFLGERLGARPRGLWLAERVWEPSLPGDLAAAGLSYAVLDDFHLRAAGVGGGEVVRPWVTGDGDKTLTVIGGSERLRYLIPYEEPERTVEFLRGLHEADPHGHQLVTMADDGEKFGVWPGTHRRVYGEGWMERFFALLDESRSWLTVSTFAEALQAVEADGPVYLPTISYMEMSEWALPPAAAERYVLAKDALAARPDLGYAGHLLRGGYWRNFLTKYPETRWLLGRTREVSGRLHRLTAGGASGETARLLDGARDELWQAQCNDAYWHGVFGGFYLPFLRAAVAEHLLRAESLVERVEHGEEDGLLLLEQADLDGDGREEFLLRSRLLTLAVDPVSGSALELGDKQGAINLFNGLTRREESYHRKVRDLAGEDEEGGAKSIHHLERLRPGQGPPRIVLDGYLRRSFTDHLWTGTWTAEEWEEGRRPAGSAGLHWESHRWGADEHRVFLELGSPRGEGPLPGLRKRFTLERDRGRVTVVLSAEPAPGGGPVRLGQELQLTPTSVVESLVEVVTGDGLLVPLPPGGRVAGARGVKITDPLRGRVVTVSCPALLSVWAAVLSTVSNSEEGYEEIPQQLALLFWREAAAGEAPLLEVSLEVGEAAGTASGGWDRTGRKR